MQLPGNSFSPRDRKAVLLGAAVLAVAFLASYSLMPAIRHWQIREVELGTSRSQLTQMSLLLAHSGALDSAATSAENLLEKSDRRVIRARSVTLAASALQDLLQNAADASALVVTRLDVVTSESFNAESDGDKSGAIGDIPLLPATIAAYGDIFGLAEFLHKLSSGPRVVRVERIAIQQNSALRGAPDVLQITVTLAAPVIVQ